MRNMIKTAVILGSILCVTVSFADVVNSENVVATNAVNNTTAVRTPRTPGVPGTPRVPGTPGAPGTPRVPGTPKAANLNEATVVVTDRSGPALQLALQSAFSEVMGNMSNNPNVMKLPAIQNASNNLTRWVQSYAYVEQPNANPKIAPTLMLRVVFDQTGLERLLKKSSKKMSQATQVHQTNQPSDSPATVLMVVSGVRSVADYTQVIRALRDKSDVMTVSVSGMQSDNVLLKVKVIGDSAEFQKMLASDNNFKSVADNHVQSKQLQYYWMGNQA